MGAIAKSDVGPRKSVDERVKELKDFLLEAPQQLDTERVKYLLEVYEEYEGQPAIIIRARLFERLLKNKKIFIDDNPIVGTLTGKRAGVYPYPEWNSLWIKDDLDKALMSHLGEIKVSEEDKRLMYEVADRWADRCNISQSLKLYQEKTGIDMRPYFQAGLLYEPSSIAVGAGTADYPLAINKGFKAIIEEVEQKLKETPVRIENSQKIDFYRAVLICLNAAIDWAHRYADLAEEMAKAETDPYRKEELLEIAEVCRWVPENPARNFREAVQSFWFTHLLLEIEQMACGTSPGRIGQYLDPYYQQDKKEGKITKEDAMNLIKFLFIKHQELGYYQGLNYATLLSGHTGQTITVGGLTPDGKDATTELDGILLEVQTQMRNIQPTISVFYHDGMSDEFLQKCVELERTGVGQPQWMNNEVVVQRLLDRHAEEGITIEDARQCANFGCVATGIAGKTSIITQEGTPNIAKIFELALNNGRDPISGLQLGPQTGEAESFTSYEELEKAFKAQLDYIFELGRDYARTANKVVADNVPSPFRCALIDGCLERGKTENEGGPRYNMSMFISTAGMDAINSLAAVKKLVFEDKKITMKELKDALAANFEGYEEIQKMCLEAPKHGNDEPEMNAFVRHIYDEIEDAYQKAGRDFLGRKGKLDAYSLSMHNYFGKFTGALPSGRKAFIALADGSVSAMPGTDKNGPTALASSAAKAIDTVRFASNHCNMKFHPSALEGPDGTRNLLALIKTYMDLGGCHIQFNCVSSDTLKDAQLNPQRYKDLVVRVAGFSAYFTRLDKGVQDEIIKRTEHRFS